MTLSSIPSADIFTLSLAVIVLILLTMQIRLRLKLKKFMIGQSGHSLEEVILKLIDRVKVTENTLGSHKQALEIINHRLSRSIRGHSLIKYDAFEDAGGNQSFAFALIDEHGNGFIISVITNRNHVGIYSKPIENFTSKMDLTPEEKQAIDEAKEYQKL